MDFDDTPDDERLGDVGDGRRVALTTLMSTGGGGGSAPGELPLAAAAAATTLERAAETAIPVRGGIGFTWAHDAHLYRRRAKVDRFLLGDDVADLDEVARLAMEATTR